jgi:hypothetical protein
MTHDAAFSHSAVVVTTGRGRGRSLELIGARGSELELGEGRGGRGWAKDDKNGQQHRVKTRCRWLWGGVGAWVSFGDREGRGRRDRRGFIGGEGEGDRDVENRANDTAFSRGVVGYGVVWVRGCHLGTGRAGAVENEGHSRGQDLKIKKT